VTDLVMPGMSGRELVEHIERQWPGLRILRTSGYIWPVNKEEEASYLQKPFTSQELLLKVKQMLSGETTMVD
jgi:two-component system, cell cycle sensor histidine kinase and response regulator CckA